MTALPGALAGEGVPTGGARRGATWLTLALIGGLLAFAGVMKLLTGMPWQITQGVAELAIVGALVRWRRCWGAWLLIACMFGAFAGWTGFQAWWGASSCGCFGAMQVAPEVTLTIDLAAMAIALATAAVWMREPTEAFAAALTAIGLCAALGAGAASALADPRPEDYGDDATAQLLAAPAYEEIGEPGGPTWFIYLYEPACPVCQRHLPEMRGLEATTADDPAFRVRALSIYEVEEAAGVPHWAWGTPPTTLIVRDGRVLQRTSAAYVDPREAAERHAAEAAAPVDPVEALLGAEAFASQPGGEAGEPALLLYLHDEGCAACAQRVAAMEAFGASMPDDPMLRAASATMQSIGGVPVEAWGAPETALVVRDGEVLRRYAPEEIPDPMDVWIALTRGLTLE